jgi:4-hydroxybenzoate polyprenyltransferase
MNIHSITATRYLGTGLSELRLNYVWAGLVLAGCYVTATCFNDVADHAVDRINHPNDNGRPLVSGDASPRQLLVLGCVSAVLGVLVAVSLGWPGVILAVVSLLVGHGYSLRPARISYRAWYLAAPVLSVGYVVVPFLLGVFASGQTGDVARRRPLRRDVPAVRRPDQPQGLPRPGR